MTHQSLDVQLKNVWSKETLGPYGENPDAKSPFSFYIFENLLEDSNVARLRDDINSSIKLKPKDNDLYKFKQSKDLRTETPAKKVTPLLHEFIDAMLDTVRIQLERLSGKKLSSKNFDITASRYDVGNYLLCHNDDIKDNPKRHGRALAFIYYLNSRVWTKDDGGALVLYDSDPTGEPIKINNRILPRPNTLVVFETSPISWHSVAEVYCKDDFRLSINGWYHSELPLNITEQEKVIEPCPYVFLKPTALDERLENIFKVYFNQEYLMNKTCMMVKKRFKKKSEINLTNFLAKEKFEEISAALRETVRNEENLTHVGPYNKRNYKVIKPERMPQICKDLYDAFQSEPFFMLLSKFTGLDLQPPSLKREARRKEGEDNMKESDDDDSDEEDYSDEGSDSSSSCSSSYDSNSDEKSESEEILVVGGAKADDSHPSAREIDSDNDENVLKIEKSRATGDIEEDDENDSESQILENKIAATSFDLKEQAESQKRKVETPTTSKEKSQETRKSPRKRKRVSDPLSRFEFRHLETGSYTLIHDHGYELGEKSALDVILNFNHDFQVNFEDGGYISYIDGAPDDDLHDMDYELLTVEPKSNCLSLVYRCDEGTCRFLKHISKSHKCDYQDLYCVYYERPDDLPNYNQQI